MLKQFRFLLGSGLIVIVGLVHAQTSDPAYSAPPAQQAQDETTLSPSSAQPADSSNKLKQEERQAKKQAREEERAKKKAEREEKRAKKKAEREEKRAKQKAAKEEKKANEATEKKEPEVK
jgi:hypothetical protein